MTQDLSSSLKQFKGSKVIDWQAEAIELEKHCNELELKLRNVIAERDDALKYGSAWQQKAEDLCSQIDRIRQIIK